MDLATLDISAVDAGYARLRELIMDAKLLPNTHHLEIALSERLFLEPIDIHEAMLRLQREGFVRLDPRGGFWVTPVRGDAIRELYNQVSVLEARAAFISATQGPAPIALNALHDSVLTMEDALYRGDLARWAAADHHFHRSLVQCSNHRQLIAAALPLSEPIHRARMLTLALRPPPFDSVHCHRQIVDAIRRGAAQEAHDHHLNHWREARDMIVDLLRVHGLDDVAIQPA